MIYCRDDSEERALKAIMDSDPDGWEFREPTDADYAAHAQWAIETYGHETWTRYVRGDWARSDWEI